MTTNAQTTFDTEYTQVKFDGVTGFETDIEWNGNDLTLPIDISATGKLAGSLTIKNLKTLENLKIANHELDELIIINCPNLKEINVLNNKITKLDIKKIKTDDDTENGNPAPTDKLEKLGAGLNVDLEEVSLEYCPKLKGFTARGNMKLDKVWGLDECKNLGEVFIEGNVIDYIHKKKLQHLEKIKEVAKKLAGVGPGGKLDTGNLTDLENKIKAGANSQIPQLKTEKENAEKEAQTAKDQLQGVETERDQLKQQLEKIRKELGLGKDATEQQALEKIKELMKRPSGPACTHTDYDAIKSKKDSLQTELEAKKRKISELENSNKENDSIITKKALVDSTNTNWDSWNIKLSNEQKEKLQNASTAKDVETTRNEIINTEIKKLKDENNGSFHLNLGLGVLTVGSLLLLAWIIMRQQINLPKAESEKKKD